MTSIPHIPESAPFTIEQRSWLNGFLAGLFSLTPAAPQPNGTPAANAEPLLVLFGSQTGSAEGLARRVAKEAQQRGFAPKILALNDHEQANLAAGGKAVIISSTWGDGDPPDNAVNFWSWLNTETAPRLEDLHFAVLGLGDKNYSDFCGAAKKFDARLEALGAKRLAPRAECDVDYETTATTWVDGLWEKLGVGQASRLSQTSSSVVPANGVFHQNGSETNNETGATPVLRYGKSNPFPARLLKNVLLNKPGSAKEVRHYEISLEGSGLTYEVGDALGVVPVNCHELVNDLLTTLRCQGDEPVKVGEQPLSLREALTRHFDITKPTQELLAAVAAGILPAVEPGVPPGGKNSTNAARVESLEIAGNSVADPGGKMPPSTAGGTPAATLAALLTPERRADLKQWLWGRDVHDVLNLLPVPMAVEQLLPLLRKLTPRLYSISSSPRAHPGEVHLTVGAVRYESHGRERKGVASTFLADRVGDTEFVKVFVQPAHGFRPPPNGETPMIMVGPGTGIAPFRAFLEERQATRAQGKNWLFFGDQKRATDFLYEEQINGWVLDGLLTRLDLAFSRDQKEKLYVQDRMLAHASELWAWLEAGAHFYVCGDASRMAKDVDAALHKIIETAGGRSGEAAMAYVVRMKSEKRYQRDVY